jgi:hypothetical protein
MFGIYHRRTNRPNKSAAIEGKQQRKQRRKRGGIEKQKRPFRQVIHLVPKQPLKQKSI